MSEPDEQMLIPARAMTSDGYLFPRFLNSDGTVFAGARGDETTAVMPHVPLGAVWDPRYNLQSYSKRDFENSTLLRKNLIYFSAMHPLLFEELFTFMEHSGAMGARIVSGRLHLVDFTPSKSRNAKKRDPADQLRELLKAAILLVRLELESLPNGPSTLLPDMDVTALAHHAEKLVKRAALCLHGYGEQLFTAACVAAWITRKSNWRPELLRAPDVEGSLQFIADNVESVVAAQEELTRLGTIDRDAISGMLNHSAALRVGVL